MADFFGLVKKINVARHSAQAPPKRKRPLAAAVPGLAMDLDYQAATTAPLYLVWMNCFTAGL